MIHFSYSFCITMLHSFWQAALLMALYFAVNKFVHKNNAPLAKRNILYLTLATQIFISIFTFCVYFLNTQTSGIFIVIAQNISTIITNETIQFAAPWIFSLYVIILVAKLIKGIYTWLHFSKQYKNGISKPAVELKLFTQLKAHQFGIKRKVKLWLSNTITTPVTFGFFKPVILLPVALVNNITVQQAETLILHELTHIRTNDYLLNWFLILSETVFFFNPFIKNICKQTRLEREKNCDLNVIAFEYKPALYAETLLQAEKMKQLIPDFQLAAVNNKKLLLTRIEYFTSKKTFTDKLRCNVLAPLGGLVLLFLLILAMLLQNGGNSLPANSAKYLPYLPVNNYAVTDADFAERNNFTMDAAKKDPANIAELNESKIIETTTPVLSYKEKIKKATAVNNNTQKQLQQTSTEQVVENNIAMLATTNENDAARQIIVKEEGSNGTSVKVYYLTYENGKWILQPEWVITAKEIITDSISAKIDSLRRPLKKTYPVQQ